MGQLFYAVADESGFGVYHYREDIYKDLGCIDPHYIYGLPDYFEAKKYAVNMYIKLSGDMIDIDYAINMMEMDNFYLQEYTDEDTMLESELLDEDLFLLLLLL